MKTILASLSIALICLSANAHAQNISAADMKKMQKMLKDPAMQAQIKAQMQAQGVNPGKLDQALKPKNMEAATGMQTCLNDGLGADGMSRLQAQGKAMHAKIKALCAEGEPTAAKSSAKAYSQKMMNSPDYKVVRKCGQQFRSQYDASDYETMMAKYGVDDDGQKEDICNGY